MFIEFNELGKSKKVQSYKFNKFIIIEAQMFDFFLSYAKKITLSSRFSCENAKICQIIATLLWRTSYHNVTKICKLLVVYRF